MKRLFLSLASVSLFAGFAAAHAGEPAAEPAPLNVPITLDAATLDGVTAAGSYKRSHKGKERCGGCGDSTFQFNQPIASPNTNLAVQVGLLSHQSSEQSIFQGNIND